jgi:ligand-binding sensor domain-containing protein
VPVPVNQEINSLPMKRILFIVSLVLLHAGIVKAQSVLLNDLKVYQLNQNLSHNTVISIFQDSKGFMWFGTFNGLNRYDGNSITVYKNNSKDSSSISSNRILQITEDLNGNIWVATTNGLCRYLREKDNFVQYWFDPKNSNSISSNRVSTVFVDSKGRLWVACDQLCLYNPKNDNFTRFPTKGSPVKEGINYLTSFICEDINGNIWFLVQKEIHKFNSSSQKLELIYDGNRYPINESNWQFYGMDQDSEGNFWIKTNLAGIIKTKFEHTDRALETFSGFSGFDYHEIMNTTIHQLEVVKNEIWFTAENKGVYVTDDSGKLIKRFLNDPSDPKTIAFNSIWALYPDKQNRIWMGTWESGISVYDPYFLKFRHYQYQPGISCLSQNNVKNFQEDSKGNVWIATDGGGLNYFDRLTNTFKVFKHNPDDPKSIGSDAVLDLEMDDNGNLWIGTWGGGVNIFKGEKEGFIKLNTQNSPILSNHCFSLINGGDGKMYIASFFGGISIYDLKTGQWEFHKKHSDLKDSLSTDVIFSINKDNNNNIWLSSDDGLSVMKANADGKKTFVSYLNNGADTASISGNANTITFEDTKYNFWVGTTSGLNLMNRKSGTFRVYTTKDGLPDESINCISSDKNGNLWIGTNKGLVKFNYDESKTKVFHLSDGLQGLQYNRQASCVLSTGEMMFGGTGGFNIFYPDSVKDNPYTPNIVFTDFKIFNKSVPIGSKSVLKKHISETKSIKLSYKEAVFTFEFVALNLTHPEENKYAYMMEGFEDNWNYAGNARSATYTNLNAGDYVFKVKAANNDGIWNEEGISIKIIITPPFWKTWWFILISLGLIVYAVYYFIKQREIQARETKEYLESKVAEGEERIKEKVEELEKQQEEIRIRDLHEQESRYLNKGLAIFSEIISTKRDDLHKLANSILNELISFVGVQQGIIFIHNKNPENPRLEIFGSYACNSKILDKKYFEEDEGYVGACYSDNSIKTISNLPEGYLTLESCFGSVSSKYLIDIPISYDIVRVGVLELASLNPIDEYKVNFLKKLCESLASIIAADMANENLKHMIEQNEQQTEELRSQEEEMRQNIEEMTATQEEFQRKQKEFLRLEEEYKIQIQELKSKKRIT